MTALGAEVLESKKKMVSGTYLHNAWYVAGWSDDAGADRREGIDLARRALRVAGDDPEVLGLAARVLGYFGEDLAAAIASPCAGRRRASWSNKRRRWLFDTPPETAVFECRELFPTPCRCLRLASRDLRNPPSSCHMFVSHG